MDRNSRKRVMVRLDQTIGLSKLSLTGVFGPMVRSSRTMTNKGGRHAVPPPMGLDPRIARRGHRDARVGIGVVPADPRVRPHAREMA
jgi:hypothetical protein